MDVVITDETPVPSDDEVVRMLAPLSKSERGMLLRYIACVAPDVFSDAMRAPVRSTRGLRAGG
jgi:hypothetical protein